MKTSVSSMILLFVLGLPVLPVRAAEPEPPFKRLTKPGEFLVKSIDEQELPAPIKKEDVLARIRLMREHKVIPVSDNRVPDFAALEAEHQARGAQLSQIVAKGWIAFSPANVDATSLRGQTLVGAISAGGRVNNSWTGMSRMYHHPELGYVVLEETDLAKTGGGAIFTKEMINADVNGAPAVLLSMQGDSKRSETSLTWFADGVIYLLRTPGVDDKSRDEILNIARHLRR